MRHPMRYTTRASVLAFVTASIFEDDYLMPQRAKLCHFIDRAQYNRSVFNGIFTCIVLCSHDLFVDNVGHHQRPDHQNG
jgi:hypothetical protein